MKVRNGETEIAVGFVIPVMSSRKDGTLLCYRLFLAHCKVCHRLMALKRHWFGLEATVILVGRQWSRLKAASRRFSTQGQMVVVKIVVHPPTWIIVEILEESEDLALAEMPSVSAAGQKRKTMMVGSRAYGVQLWRSQGSCEPLVCCFLWEGSRRPAIVRREEEC